MEPVDEGTQTATLDTEHSLGGPITDPGTYTLTVNLENMVAGDTVVLRGYTRVLTAAGQTFLAYSAEFANAQGDGDDAGSEAAGDVLAISIPIPSAYEVEFTLTQENGTGRAFQWRVDRL